MKKLEREVNFYRYVRAGGFGTELAREHGISQARAWQIKNKGKSIEDRAFGVRCYRPSSPVDVFYETEVTRDWEYVAYLDPDHA